MPVVTSGVVGVLKALRMPRCFSVASPGWRITLCLCQCWESYIEVGRGRRTSLCLCLRRRRRRGGPSLLLP